MTVLMSCFNGERWLAQAVESVLEQTFTDFEFVAIDDGSRDGTRGVLEAYASFDTRMRLIVKPNTGLADSLNEGIRAAVGRWIARIDADDIWHPEKLARQMSWIHAHPQAVLLGTGLQLMDVNSRRYRVYQYPSGHRGLVTHLQSARPFPAHSSVMYRTDAVVACGGYRPRIRKAEDTDLWLRLSNHGVLGSLPEPLTLLRRHSDQMSLEDSGRQQFLDSRVALTAYWIRKLSGIDPVDAEDAVFWGYRRWIVSELERRGDLEYQARRTRIAASLRAAPNSLGCTVRALGASIREVGTIYRMTKERWHGDGTAKQLASDWVESRLPETRPPAGEDGS